jgi:putative FmdB family regulatory protein
MKVLVHVYECEGCDVLFAVSQSFEEQHLLQCPVCKTDKALHEVSSGELRIQQKEQPFIVPEGQTNIYEFLR